MIFLKLFSSINNFAMVSWGHGPGNYVTQEEGDTNEVARPHKVTSDKPEGQWRGLNQDFTSGWLTSQVCRDQAGGGKRRKQQKPEGASYFSLKAKKTSGFERLS